MTNKQYEGEIIAIFHDHYTNNGDAVSLVIIEDKYGFRRIGKYRNLNAAHMLSSINDSASYRANFIAKCKYHYKANKSLVVDLVKVVPR